MKTLDGYELEEDESCYVSIQCPEGIHHLSPNPRKAVYLDEMAKENGWDFTFSRQLRADCIAEVIAT